MSDKGVTTSIANKGLSFAQQRIIKEAQRNYTIDSLFSLLDMLGITPAEFFANKKFGK